MSCIPINDFSLITLCDATKAGKLYSIVPDSGAGDFDVARASTATYLGADGLIKTAANNEPRIEFNEDGTYKGLLVEPAATNLLLRSEEFDDAYWDKTQCTVSADVADFVDGNQVADLIEGTGSFPRIVRVENASFLNENTNYTLSVFAKPNTASKIRLRVVNRAGVACSVDFDLANGGVFAEDNAVGGAIFLPKFGYYRCFMNFNSGVGSSNIDIRPVFGSGALGAGALGDGTSVYAGGAQLEESPVATSYIPTVASTVTRAADVISRTATSALIGQTEGTIYAEVNYRQISPHSGRQVFEIGTDTNNTIFCGISAVNNNLMQFAIVNNSNSVVISTTPNTGILKIGLRYTTSNLSVFINGIKIDEITNTVGIPTMSTLLLGRRINSTRSFNDHIKAFALLPTALTEQQAIQLTS